MRRALFFILPAILLTGCSQDESDQTSRKVVTVEKKIEKSSGKESAMVCLDEKTTITCKLVTKRVNRERTVVYRWRSPNGSDDREREMVLPANHASIFDLRKKSGRAKGEWKVLAEIDDEEVSTRFTVQ